MPSYHGRVACQAIPSRPVNLLVASYSSNGQLISTVISGDNKHRYSSFDAPDEGIFIMFQDRAIQIAAPPCEQRKCKTICCCDTSYRSIKIHSSYQKPRRRKVSWPMWKPCQGCLVNWLRLYPATEAARKLGLQFLQYPRTLTWSVSNGCDCFQYDAELEEESICSNNNGSCTRLAAIMSPCPPKLFKWMLDTWTEFTRNGCHKPGCGTILSNSEDGTADEESADRGNDWESDGEWDDLDIPCQKLNQSHRAQTTEEFDCIDDLIKEGEFFQLQDTPAIKSNIQQNEKTRAQQPQADEEDESSGSDDDDDEDTPAPVILPPKNMSIGQGLELPKESLVPDVIHPRRESVTYATNDLLRPSLGHKRSHGDFEESDNHTELLPAEDSPRMTKYQKREFSVPSASNRFYHHGCQRSAVHLRPFSRIGYASQELLVA